MRGYESVPTVKRDILRDKVAEVGQLRDVNGVTATITSVGIRADDKQTKERILGGATDEIWAAFQARRPVSPEQIQSAVLQRLLQFGTPKQAYLKALERE